MSSSSEGSNTLLMREVRVRRARLVKTDRDVTVTQITTHYNSGVQKSISEHATQHTNLEVDRLQ